MTSENQSVNQSTILAKRFSKMTHDHKTRNDRWVNEKNNFGTSSDPMVNTSFYRERILTRGELEALYVQDWLAKRVVNIPADDATRNWISLTSGDDNTKAEAVKKEMDRLNIQAKVHESIVLSRLHGGSLLVLGAFDGQETDMELNNIRSVEFVEPVDRWQTHPQRYYADETKMNYGQPETYLVHRVQVRGTLTAIVHESRTIRFEGHYLPPLEKLRNLGWNISVLQNFYEELKRFGSTHQTVGAIIQDFVTKKVQIKGLRELLSNVEGEQQLMARFATLAYGMSVHNLAVFGDDEQFEKMGTPLTGLDKVMTHFVDIVSAASEIPKARLFHNQSGILGGDAGESDLRVHYDNISSYQETKLRPHIKRIVDVIAESLGYGEDEVGFEFNPLWQLSELDEAKSRKEISESDINYINAGVVEPEEVALSRFSGEGINLADMIIDVDKRKRFLEALSKVEPDLDEGEPDDDEEEVEMAGQENNDSLPEKRAYENKSQFVIRGMKDETMIAKYPNDKERHDACLSQWEKQ